MYSLHDAMFEMDLTQLEIIELGVSEPTFVYSCHGFADGVTVVLFADGLKTLYIQVSADREDKLMAALSYLSPDANLRSRR